MARKKNLVPLFGVAFIVAIISTGVFYGLFVGKLNSASTTPTTAGKVWVAARAMESGTVLKQADIKEINWPAPPLPAGAVQKVEELEGKTLAEPVAANQLLLNSQIAAPGGGHADSGGMGIPQGKRAVSLQVQDSAGVVAMLKPGHRVDIQVVGVAPGAAVAEPMLRTVLENMTVLSVPKEVSTRGGANIVTVLASPRESALLGLADSTAKIRVALRNPVDQKQENPGGVGLSTLFRGGNTTVLPSMNMASAASPAPPASAASAPSSPAAASKPTQRHIELLVRVSSAQWEEIAPRVEGVKSDSLQVLALKKQEGLDAALQTVSSARLSSAKGREAGMRWTLSEKAAEVSCGLDIQFSPQIEADGHVRVRVQPEVTLPASSGVNRRRISTDVDVADGQSFLVRGFAPAVDLPLLWEKLFARTANTSKDMLVVVTPQIVKESARTAAPASE